MSLGRNSWNGVPTMWSNCLGQMSSSETICRLGVLMFGYTSMGGNGLATTLSMSGWVRRMQVLPLSLEGTKVRGSLAGTERFLCTSVSIVMNTV